jgi:hypothetical protein
VIIATLELSFGAFSIQEQLLVTCNLWFSIQRFQIHSIVGVDRNVSPTLLMKEERLRKLYLRSLTFLKEVKSRGAQCYI